jgi:hypothetical protein
VPTAGIGSGELDVSKMTYEEYLKQREVTARGVMDDKLMASLVVDNHFEWREKHE